jgi:hypothetical protein
MCNARCPIVLAGSLADACIYMPAQQPRCSKISSHVCVLQHHPQPELPCQGLPHAVSFDFCRNVSCYLGTTCCTAAGVAQVLYRFESRGTPCQTAGYSPPEAAWVPHSSLALLHLCTWCISETHEHRNNVIHTVTEPKNLAATWPPVAAAHNHQQNSCCHHAVCTDTAAPYTALEATPTTLLWLLLICLTSSHLPSIHLSLQRLQGRQPHICRNESTGTNATLIRAIVTSKYKTGEGRRTGQRRHPAMLAALQSRQQLHSGHK